MPGDQPIVRLPDQSGDVSIGTAAQSVTYQGADANKLIAMMELIVKNDWDDRQQREIRMAQVDETARIAKDQADFHREMTRQRLERIASDVTTLAQDITATHRLTVQAQRWLIGLTAAVVLLALIVLAVVADRVAAGLVLAAWLATRGVR